MGNQRRARGEGAIYKKAASVYWWISYTVDGTRLRESSRTTQKARAAELLRQRLAAVADGTFKGDGASQLKFDDLEELLKLNYKIKKRRSWDRAKRAFNSLRTYFAGWRVNRIDGGAAVMYNAARLDEEAEQATINYEIAILKRAITVARAMGRTKHVLEHTMEPVENARTGFFERSEFELVSRQLTEDLRAVMLFAFVTGWRKQEILKLEWSMVDLSGKVIRLTPELAKNKDGRTFPFGKLPELEELIIDQRRKTSAAERGRAAIVRHVFHRAGVPIKSYDAAWRAACLRASVDTLEDGTVRQTRPALAGRLVHDFRRTAVRNLTRAGVPRSVAMAMTGHKTESVFQRYDIVNEADLTDASAKLAVHHAKEKAALEGAADCRGTEEQRPA